MKMQKRQQTYIVQTKNDEKKPIQNKTYDKGTAKPLLFYYSHTKKGDRYMAVFQNPKYHADQTIKRELNRDDISFLKNLQTELNTQDTMGNADPRYWVVRQSHMSVVPEDYAENTILCDSSDGQTWNSLDEFMEDFAENAADDYGITAEEKPYDDEHDEKELSTWELTIDGESYEVSDFDDLMLVFEEQLIDRYHICYTAQQSENCSDSLFLTHKDCEDYLRKYHYNHPQDAHAYAMTAVRSPRFERLINILQTIDFTALEKLLDKAETDSQ